MVKTNAELYMDGGGQNWETACAAVAAIPYNLRCDYVKASSECKIQKHFVSYMQFLYCTVKPDTAFRQAIGAISLILLCCLIFMIVACTAEQFFCPALKVLSKNLGMSEHLAGVTLLAFGNTSPDFFTSLATLHDKEHLLMSDILGSGMFITTLVAGVITFIKPMQVSGYHFVRDVCFYLLGVLYIDYAMVSDNHVTIMESVFIILLYVLYLTTVMLDQFLVKRAIKKLERRIVIHKRLNINAKLNSSQSDLEQLNWLRNQVGMDVIAKASHASINVALTRKVSYNAFESTNSGIFKQFTRSVNPIDLEQWKNKHVCKIAFLLVNVPIDFCLLCILPVVDYELDRHGWSKLLNILQLNILPLLIGLQFTIDSDNMPMFLITLVVTIPLSAVVFFTTRTDIPPPYHPFFALLSAVGSVFIIYNCASEIVEILEVLGLVSGSSKAFLGCTILAWGNSVGDLVSNVALAKQGYAIMSFAACYGGSLCGALLTLGCTYLYKTLTSTTGYVVLHQGPLGENMVVFLVIVLSCNILWSVSKNFYVSRSIGVFYIIVYIIFFAYALLGELEIIQTMEPISTALT